MVSFHLEVTDVVWRARGKQLLPPTVVTALLWIGVQALVLLYLRTAIGYLTVRDVSLAVEFQHELMHGSGGGLLVVTWVWITNLAFVLLLGVQLLSRRRPLTRRRDLAFITYGGTALLLLLANAAWRSTLDLAEAAQHLVP